MWAKTNKKMEQHLLIPEIINRLEKRKREVWQSPSPYISPKEEWLELVIKIKELKKIKA